MKTLLTLFALLVISSPQLRAEVRLGIFHAGEGVLEVRALSDHGILSGRGTLIANAQVTLQVPSEWPEAIEILDSGMPWRFDRISLSDTGIPGLDIVYFRLESPCSLILPPTEEVVLFRVRISGDLEGVELAAWHEQCTKNGSRQAINSGHTLMSGRGELLSGIYRQVQGTSLGAVRSSLASPRVYPNPSLAGGIIRIQTDQAPCPETMVQLCSPLGSVIAEHRMTDLMEAGMPAPDLPGIYLLRIKDAPATRSTVLLVRRD